MVPDPACVSVAVIPPGDDVAVYETIVAPPLLLGTVNATVAVLAPVAVAVPIVGAVGAVIAEVAGNTAVTVAELALFVTVVAVETVKKFAVTPVTVYDESGTTVIVAVYAVLAPKVDGFPFHVIVVAN